MNNIIEDAFFGEISLTRIYRPINPHMMCVEASCKSCLSTFKTGKHQFTQFCNESATKANSLFGLLNNDPPVDLEQISHCTGVPVVKRH